MRPGPPAPRTSVLWAAFKTVSPAPATSFRLPQRCMFDVEAAGPGAALRPPAIGLAIVQGLLKITVSCAKTNLQLHHTRKFI